ncbi:hypothetical protein M6D81_07765 [Paenibacillus sp. J5C_2022]|uniref:hypothetical protein n=1 Tax=Paenibacillus sp. J5C2022 TaxID=2977129 RepID=UPI0021CE0639|nr:hypothetical protein [Paenibacillus sp. J5C2022]MCU6708611.1 hypothetical protein [Paenibacillus sp. J5C2022]
MVKWEDRLASGPYEARLAHEQVHAIQQKIALASEGKRKKYVLKWIVPICLAMSIAVLAFTLEIKSERVGLLAGGRLTDEQILAQIHKEYRPPERVLLHKHPIGEEGVLTFTNVIDYDRKGMVWELGYLSNNTRQWVSGGDIKIDFLSADEYEKMVAEGSQPVIAHYADKKSGLPVPVVYGVLMNPSVAQVQLSGEQLELQQAVVIDSVHGGYSLWYALLPEHGLTELTIRFADAKGATVQLEKVKTSSL